MALELTTEGTGIKIESIDATVPEIADQQVLAEATETIRSQGQTPGRVERPPRSQASDQIPIGAEDIDEPIACTLYIIMMGRILKSKGDNEVAPNVLDAEGCEALGWWSCNRTIARQRRIGKSMDELKVGVELLYLPEAKIGGVEEVVEVALPRGKPLIDCTRDPP